MKPRHLILLLTSTLTMLVLTGCFFSFSVSSGSGTSTVGSTSLAPCFQDTCADKVTVAVIGDAENLLFSSTGRLFVSGGENLFEITQSSTGAYVSTVVSTATCNFTGLSIINDTLYAACFNGSLWAGSLSQLPLQVRSIATLPAVTAGNGLVDGPDGSSLYLVNGPSGQTPQIIKITLNPLRSTEVLSAQPWLSTDISFPNGLQRKGSLLYFTDSDAQSLGRIKTVNILSNGTAGTVQSIAAFNSLPDDISFIDSDFAVPFFSSGQIARVSANGLILQSTGANRFANPSQVRITRGPLFRDGDLLVTEKGVIGDNASSVGNILTLYKTRS
jgi:sugar lactone lactonase YvrE